MKKFFFVLVLVTLLVTLIVPTPAVAGGVIGTNNSHIVIKAPSTATMGSTLKVVVFLDSDIVKKFKTFDIAFSKGVVPSVDILYVDGSYEFVQNQQIRIFRWTPKVKAWCKCAKITFEVTLENFFFGENYSLVDVSWFDGRTRYGLESWFVDITPLPVLPPDEPKP